MRVTKYTLSKAALKISLIICITRLKQHNHCFHMCLCRFRYRGENLDIYFWKKKKERRRKWGRESEEAHSKSEEAFEAKTKVRRQVPPLPQ